MEAKEVKIWERGIRKKKTGDKEGGEEKNKTTRQRQAVVKCLLTTPQKPLTDSTIQLPTPIIKKGGSAGI